VKIKNKIYFAIKYFFVTLFKWSVVSLILIGVIVIPFYLFTVLLK